MSNIECIILFMIVEIGMLISLLIGIKIGQDKKIELNPVKVIKEARKESKAAKDEELRRLQLETNLKNIESYDGTGLGQTQIPR